MTTDEKLELLVLKNVLDDTLICSHTNPKSLDNAINRYTKLIDKFLLQYKASENSANDSLKN